MIPVNCCQNKLSIISFITDEMTSKFEPFSNKKMNNLYPIEIMRTDWLQMLDESSNEQYKPYSDDIYLWPDWLLQYYN